MLVCTPAWRLSVDVELDDLRMGAWREPTVFDLVRRRLPFFFFLFPVRFVVVEEEEEEEEELGRMDLEVGMPFGSRRSVEVAGSSLSRSSKIVDSLSSNMFFCSFSLNGTHSQQGSQG